MKKLLFLLCMMFIMTSSFGQWLEDRSNAVNSTEFKEAKQKMLTSISSERYDHINKQIITGKSLFFGGTALSALGVIIATQNDKIFETESAVTVRSGCVIAIIGGLSSFIGLPVWISGVNKKADFSIEVANYYKGGGAVIKFNF